MLGWVRLQPCSQRLGEEGWTGNGLTACSTGCRFNYCPFPSFAPSPLSNLVLVYITVRSIVELAISHHYQPLFHYIFSPLELYQFLLTRKYPSSSTHLLVANDLQSLSWFLDFAAPPIEIATHLRQAVLHLTPTPYSP